MGKKQQRSLKKWYKQEQGLECMAPWETREGLAQGDGSEWQEIKKEEVTNKDNVPRKTYSRAEGVNGSEDKHEDQSSDPKTSGRN